MVNIFKWISVDNYKSGDYFDINISFILNSTSTLCYIKYTSHITLWGPMWKLIKINQGSFTARGEHFIYRPGPTFTRTG